MTGARSSAGAFAISTPHHVASEAGARVMRQGGNAIDAALVASIVLTVVYPHNCQLGGDLIALVDRAGSDTIAVNSTGTAAAATDVDRLRSASGTMPTTGIDTVTVPGVVAGWLALFEGGSTLDWDVLFEQAIALANEGAPVARGLAEALGETPPGFADDPGMRSVFAPRGELLAAGDALLQPALGRTLESLAGNGPESLYGGEVGERLVRTLAALGSDLSLEDLRRHEAWVESPLSREFQGHEVLTAPPNSQGFLLLGILGALEHLAEGGEFPPAALAGLFAAANRDRERYLADPGRSEVPVEELLAPDRLALRARLAAEGSLWNPDAPVGVPKPRGDTVAVVTSDAAGNSVSLIQSVFGSFGSGILCPETGIVLHNRGASFSLDPDSPNVIGPGKRPAHTLMPVMVRRDGALRYVNGTMGGLAQAQIHTQLILRLLAGDDPATAVAAPRWIVGEPEVGGDGAALLAEARVPRETLNELTAGGFTVTGLRDFDDEVGHSQVIRIEPDGSFDAGSDPRCDGRAIAEGKANDTGPAGRGMDG